MVVVKGVYLVFEKGAFVFQKLKTLYHRHSLL